MKAWALLTQPPPLASPSQSEEGWWSQGQWGAWGGWRMGLVGQPLGLESKQAPSPCGLWGGNSPCSISTSKAPHIFEAIIDDDDDNNNNKEKREASDSQAWAYGPSDTWVGESSEIKLFISVAYIYERVREKCISFIKGRSSSYKVMSSGHRRSLALLDLEWCFWKPEKVSSALLPSPLSPFSHSTFPSANTVLNYSATVVPSICCCQTVLCMMGTAALHGHVTAHAMLEDGSKALHNHQQQNGSRNAGKWW